MSWRKVGWQSSLTSRCSTSRITASTTGAPGCRIRNCLNTLPRSNRAWRRNARLFAPSALPSVICSSILPTREWAPSGSAYRAQLPRTVEPMAIPNGDSGWVFEASGLKKEYDDGQVQALRGVDFRIQQGEFITIVGPSGSGKSTLLQMLGALDRPTAGTLKYRGASLA